MKTKTSLSKILIIFSLALVTLSACSEKSKESPEAVIKKFQNNANSIESMDADLKLVMTGEDGEDNIAMSADMELKMDNRVEGDRKFDVHLKVDGDLAASGQQMNAKLELMARVLGDQFYVNLAELDSTDPSVENFKPALEPYLGKWLHVASDFVPQDLRQLQQKDDATLEREAQMKELFAGAKLFEVSKEFGTKSVNGHKTYHYGLKLNKKGLEEYIRQTGTINGAVLSEEEVKEASQFADSAKEIEFWIGVDDYQLYKATATLSGSNLEQGVESTIEVEYNANSYNKNVDVEEPKNFEEFNPLSLLMGLQPPAGALEGGLPQ